MSKNRKCPKCNCENVMSDTREGGNSCCESCQYLDKTEKFDIPVYDKNYYLGLIEELESAAARLHQSEDTHQILMAVKMRLFLDHIKEILEENML